MSLLHQLQALCATMAPTRSNAAAGTKPGGGGNKQKRTPPETLAEYWEATANPQATQARRALAAGHQQEDGARAAGQRLAVLPEPVGNLPAHAPNEHTLMQADLRCIAQRDYFFLPSRRVV